MGGRHRPSGSEQRKKKKARLADVKSLSASMTKYLTEERTRGEHSDRTSDRSSSSCGQGDGAGTEEDDGHLSSPTGGNPQTDVEDSDEDMDIPNDEPERQGGDDDLLPSNPEDRASAITNPVHSMEGLATFHDISIWPAPVPDSLRVALVKRGSSCIQNKDGPFTDVCRDGESSKGGTRHLSSQWFYISLPNGEKVLRTWLIYSKLEGKLFCFCCRLFTNDITGQNLSSFITGFSSWWRLSPKVHDHEKSPAHQRCLDDWKVLAAGLKHGKTFDALNQSLLDTERKKWRDVLHRILDVVLFLSKQNLAFRGHNEDESSHNRGNFLELVELLSKYDAPLKEHLLTAKSASEENKQVTSYLSSTIQNEFISILGNHVKQKIVRDIKKAKYFGIIFDSTPDISHVDQMSEVIRYVNIEDDGTVVVNESFLGFFPIGGKSAAELTEQILAQLNRDGLDIALCRGQGYDNAAVMAGLHGGVQAKIKELNPKALFVPCANHSLNLCGVHAFSSGPECVTFFGTLEKVYSIFAVSTHRWDILKSFGLHVKRLCPTRWSASYDAVKVIRRNFKKLILAMEKLCDPKENADTRGSFQILLPAVCKFSFLCYLHLWNDVLHEVDDAQKYLQKPGISLEQCAVKLDALKLFLENNRDQIVDDSIEYATATCTEMGISMEKRVRYRKLPGDPSKQKGITLQEECKAGMLQCLARFHRELQTRAEAFSKIRSVFEIIQTNSLMFGSQQDLESARGKLTEVFDEVSVEDIVPEIHRLRRHLAAAKVPGDVSRKWNSVEFLEFIHQWDYSESLPNLELCLRLYLTVCVSVASCERSFSKLNLIKNFLRATMGEERLTNLAILSIEHDYVKTIDFDDIIAEFAELKPRRKPI